MPKFCEGQYVTSNKEFPALGISAGDTGVVWAAYETDPPSYEVTFSPEASEAFDVTVVETDLDPVESPKRARAANTAERTVEAA